MPACHLPLAPGCDPMADFVRNKVSILLELDWVERHQVWHGMTERYHPDVLVAIAKQLGSDQLLMGMNVSVTVPPDVVISLPSHE